MPTALVLLVYALAVARVTRLVNQDRVTEGLRQRLVDWLWMRHWTPAARIAVRNGGCHADDGRPLADVRACARLYAQRVQEQDAEPPLLVYLVTCPWCVSIYVGAVAAPLIWFWGSSPWLAIPALALALSQVTGLLATKGE